LAVNATVNAEAASKAASEMLHRVFIEHLPLGRGLYTRGLILGERHQREKMLSSRGSRRGTLHSFPSGSISVDWEMEEISRILLPGVAMLAAVLLFTPYEAVLEGVVAIAIIAAVVLGFLLHPRKEVFYVRTTVRLCDADGNLALEHDYLAVKVELARLWLLFLPTFLAVGFLVVSSAGGILWKFSLLNTIFSSEYRYIAFCILHALPVIVVVFLLSWIRERWVMRDAEACSARSYSVANRTVSYLFMGECGEYYGGYGYHFGLVRPMQLATIVFHNARKPELNKIAMGFLFHRPIILGRGVTDLDKQTANAQAVLAETTS
jgi:hypothetical protein